MSNPDAPQLNNRVLIKFFDSRGLLICSMTRSKTEAEQTIQAVKDQMWELARRTVDHVEVINL